jgi:hypothetical protein
MEEWRRLESAATGGEWLVMLPKGDNPDAGIMVPGYACIIGEFYAEAKQMGVADRNEALANAEFCAAARMAMPALLAEVERLQAECERRAVLVACATLGDDSLDFEAANRWLLALASAVPWDHLVHGPAIVAMVDAIAAEGRAAVEQAKEERE